MLDASPLSANIPEYIAEHAEREAISLRRTMGPEQPEHAVTCPECMGRGIYTDPAPAHYPNAPVTLTRCLICDGRKWITPPRRRSL
ncbi:hypothetical protein [Pseudogemmobacter sonorensis]|uniref:hypothetical protein n=1 Tax=Pseudogemmobacter sonorensis TaxID=2989681 RepID=UPI00369C4625